MDLISLAEQNHFSGFIFGLFILSAQMNFIYLNQMSTTHLFISRGL